MGGSPGGGCAFGSGRGRNGGFRDALRVAGVEAGDVTAMIVGDADRADATPETVADWSVHTDVPVKASQADIAKLNEALGADSRVAHGVAGAVYSGERETLSVFLHVECARARVEKMASAIINDALVRTTIGPTIVARELLVRDEWMRPA